MSSQESEILRARDSGLPTRKSRGWGRVHARARVNRLSLWPQEASKAQTHSLEPWAVSWGLILLWVETQFGKATHALTSVYSE